MLCIRENADKNRIAALAAVKRVDSIDLLKTFGDQNIAAYIRSKAAGSIAVIGGLFFPAHASVANREQIILVEMLSELLARDYTYVVYHPCDKAGLRRMSCKLSPSRASAISRRTVPDRSTRLTCVLRSSFLKTRIL